MPLPENASIYCSIAFDLREVSVLLPERKRKMEQTKTTTGVREMVQIALAAALIAVCSWITVPLPAVPFTLQTFGVFCVLSLLGGKRGSIAVFLYLLLGAVGVPVFSGFSGGIGHLTGPTGGYLFGFLLSAFLYTVITHFFGTKKYIKLLAMLVGLAACYICGTFWFSLLSESGLAGFFSAFSACVLPFIIPDLVKISAALILSERLLRIKYFR